MTTLTLVNPATQSCPDDSVLVVAVLKDEKLRLAPFLDHYRRLGVGRFFVIDNDSSDGSLEYLVAQPDVTVYSASGNYMAARKGRDWTDEVRSNNCDGRWVLTVDVDELLVFPLSEQVSLGGLCSYLEATESDALFTVMLDMYPQEPLDQLEESDEHPLSIAPYFDHDGYVADADDQGFPALKVIGGPRRRIFFADGARGPQLRKVPLVKWSRSFDYLSSTHAISPLRLAPVTGCLLHFKLFPGFSDRAVEDNRLLTDAQIGRDRMADVFEAYEAGRSRTSSSLTSDVSSTFDSSIGLVRLGLLKASRHYANFQLAELRAAIGRDAATVVYQDLKTAAAEAAERFQPDLRNALQLWDAIRGVTADLHPKGRRLPSPADSHWADE